MKDSNDLVLQATLDILTLTLERRREKMPARINHLGQDHSATPHTRHVFRSSKLVTMTTVPQLKKHLVSRYPLATTCSPDGLLVTNLPLLYKQLQ